MTHYNLFRGKMVELPTAKEKTAQIRFQTESLKQEIEKIGIREKGYMLPLMDAVDVTKEEYKLAQTFSPKLTFLGLESRSELRSANIESYFRIIKDNEYEENRVIQWIYGWPKPRLSISFWVTVLPLFFLGLLSLLIFNYLSFESAAISVAIISVIFIRIGLSQLKIARQSKKGFASYYSNRQFFSGFGITFDFLLAEIYFSKGTSQNLTIFEGAKSWHPIIYESLPEFTIRLSWISTLFFSVAALSLILWLIGPPLGMKNYDIDWAAIFIYIQKNEDTNIWEMKKIRYSSVDYSSGKMTVEELKKSRALIQNRPNLEISDFWQKLEPADKRMEWINFLFYLSLCIIGIGIMVICLFLGSDMHTFDGILSGSGIILFLFGPILITIGGFAAIAKWPNEISDKIHEKMVNGNYADYHLSDERLILFWNINDPEASLRIRTKLQDPFLEDELFTTFGDDFEQILFHTILPEISKIQQENFFRNMR